MVNCLDFVPPIQVVGAQLEIRTDVLTGNVGLVLSYKKETTFYSSSHTETP